VDFTGTLIDYIFAYFSFSDVGKLIFSSTFLLPVSTSGEKFISSVIDSGEQFFISVSLTKRKMLGFLVISDRYQRHWGKIVWFEVVLAASGASDQGAPFHGSSNDTIGTTVSNFGGR
jgi:hypothetical protein